MTRLLYIPTGEYIQFIRSPMNNGTIISPENRFTLEWEESQWCKIWEETLEDAILQFCKPDHEVPTKERHNIDPHKPLVRSEFEIIKS